MSSCLQELERCFLTRQDESEEKISYPPELRREARETFYKVNGRYPTSQELEKYIASDQEALDFFRRKNARPE